MSVRWWPATKVRARGGESTLIIKNKNFSRLWSAQVLSQIAQNLLNFALIIRVYDLAQHTRLANISVALVILSFGVPSIFFAAAAGVYVDHWNRKHVLVIANLLRGVLVLGYLLFEHNLAIVLLLSFVISSITQFFAPAEASSIPKLVTEKQLLRANSLFVFTMYASFIIGYSGSAPVIGLFGPDGPYLLTAIMFMMAALLVSGLPTMKPSTRHAVAFKTLVKRTGREIVQNFQLIRSNHKLAFPILQLTITQAIVGVILALAPALSVAVLHTQLQDASHILIIPAGVGLVVGVVMVGQVSKFFSRITIISVSLLAAAISLVLLGLTGELHRVVHGVALASPLEISVTVAVLVLILGFMNALVSSVAQTLLQENTTDATRGKVFGALNMMVNIAATLPILFAGVLADLTSVTRVIAAIGVLLVIFALGQFIVLRRGSFLQLR